MTLHYLLDTNIISEPVRAVPNANVMTKLIEAKSTVAPRSFGMKFCWAVIECLILSVAVRSKLIFKKK